MENASEALFMAAAVLVFMVAVSLTLSSFSTFRNDLEDIILADERIDMATQKDSTGKESYINYISSSEECRTVGIDTIANSLYRVYKENYIVVIKLKNKAEYSAIKNFPIVKTFSNPIIDGSVESNKVKEQQYTKKSTGEKITIIRPTDTVLVFDIPISKNDKKYVNKVLEDGLYNKLKDKTFIEYTGVYYENDKVELGTDLSTLSTDENDSKFKISVANKTKARVITYIEQ